METHSLRPPIDAFVFSSELPVQISPDRGDQKTISPGLFPLTFQRRFDVRLEISHPVRLVWSWRHARRHTTSKRSLFMSVVTGPPVGLWLGPFVQRLQAGSPKLIFPFERLDSITLTGLMNFDGSQ